MGSIVKSVGNLVKDTAGFFTGGTSGVNLANGQAPTAQTLSTDAAGLGLGMGLSGLTGALFGSGASGAALDPLSEAAGQQLTADFGGTGGAASSGVLGNLGSLLGSGGKNLLGTGLQMYQMNTLSNALRNLGNNASNFSSLDQAQRQPYQQNLSQLINNPQQYLSTDPFATSLAALYKNQIIPRQISQTGNPASVLDTQGSQFVNQLASNYNTQVGNLSGIAGFGFPQSPMAGYLASNLGTGSAAMSAGTVGALGNLFGTNMGQTMGQSGTGLFGKVA